METASRSIKNWLFSTTLLYSKVSLTLGFSSSPPRNKIIQFWGQFPSDLQLFAIFFSLYTHTATKKVDVCKVVQIWNLHWQ